MSARSSLRRFIGGQGSFHRMALVVLSLGVALAATVWSLHQRTLEAPLPGVDPALNRRLVSLELHQGRAQYPFSLPLLEELQSQVGALQDVAGVSTFHASLFSAGSPASRVRIDAVTDGYFKALGVRLPRGEAPRASGSGPEGVVISHRIWQTRFQGREDVVGLPLRLNQDEAVVSGVAPAQFGGSWLGLETDVWASIRRTRPARLEDPASGLFFQAVGLLTPSASRAQLQNQLEAFASALEPRVWGLEDSGQPARLLAFDQVGLDAFTIRSLEARFRILFGIALIVLSTAVLNGSGLLLSASLALRKRWAIAGALGASRLRISLQVLSDALLLAVLVAVTATGLASLGEVWLDQAGLIREAPSVGLRWDWSVFGFSLVLALGASLLCSLLPALAATRVSLVDGLRDVDAVSWRFSRWKSGLVVGQLAASFFLVMGSALLLLSLFNLASIDRGIESEGVASAYLEPSSVGLQGEEILHFGRRLWDRLAAVSGVRSQAFAEISPFVGTRRSIRISRVEGAPDLAEPITVWRNKVTPGFFETVQLECLGGRVFTEIELLRARAEGEEIVVVSRQVAERLWPGSTPLGQRLFNDNEKKWLRVVGVVEDHRPYSMFEDAAMIYEPLGQGFVPGRFAILARGDSPTGATAARLGTEVAEAVHALDPRIAVFDSKSLRERRDGGLQQARSLAGTVPLLALAAFVLAATSLWGLMTGAVRLTRREIGIRLALGARVWDLQKSRLRQSLLLAAVGIGSALAVLFLVREWAGEQLYQVRVFEPALLLPACLAFAAGCLLLSFLPLRRMTRIDPCETLRAEG